MPQIQTSVLITEKQIQKRVQEIASELNTKFKNKKVLCLCTLKGAFTFFSDLVRKLDFDLICDFCATSCYGYRNTPSKEVRLSLDTELDMEGKDVLLIEDIIDRGLTMQFLQAHFKKRNPKSLTTVTLVAKPEKITHPCQIDHIGFKVKSDAFLVGYGMDYQEQFRHLPHIAEISNLN